MKFFRKRIENLKRYRTKRKIKSLGFEMEDIEDESVLVAVSIMGRPAWAIPSYMKEKCLIILEDLRSLNLEGTHKGNLEIQIEELSKLIEKQKFKYGGI